MNILVQMIGGIGYTLLAISYFRKQKNKILYLQIFANLFFLVHYYLLSGITGAVCSLVALVALVVIYLSDKHNFKYKKYLIAVLLATLYIVTFLSYKNIFSLFPIIATTATILSFFAKKENTIRMIGIFTAISWLIYAVVYKSYVSIAFEIITVISTYIAFMKNYKFVSIRVKAMSAIITGMFLIIGITMGLTYLNFGSGTLEFNMPNYVVAVLPSLSVFLTMVLIGVLFFIDYSIIHPINVIANATKKFAYDSNENREENVKEIFDIKYNKRNDELGKLYSAIAMTTRESTEFADDIESKSQKIAKMQSGLIMVLSEMVEGRDEGTGAHIRKTKAYVEIIVNEMKKQGIYKEQLTDKLISDTINSAPLHDIGKIHIPDNILIKPGKLTDEEYEIMKTHTTFGAKMIQYTIDQMGEDDAGYLLEAKNVAEFHHEKWNGTGYPTGIKENEIPLSARIMAVADVFDALVSKRSYKEPFSFDKAIEIIEKDSGTHFDPMVVKAFLAKKEEVKKVAELYEKELLMEKTEVNNIKLKYLNWSYYKLFRCIFGLFLNSLAINLFIVPNNLYTGGVLGFAQLVRSAINSNFNVNFPFDISSVIYYMINIPLFIVAYKDISKSFFRRTLFSVTVNSIFLGIIPIPTAPLIDNMLANVVIGGIIGGIGIGIVLSTGSSTGGTDIIGFAISKKHPKITVGAISLVLNVIIYAICGIFYGVEIMLYSIMTSIFESLNIDRYHTQNISSEVFLITKKNPAEIIKYINYTLNRGATYWEAKGGYTNKKVYIVYVVLSKYERMRLERHLSEFDEDVFMVGDDGVNVQGHFEKYLV